jgi:hypothetical protein
MYGADIVMLPFNNDYDSSYCFLPLSILIERPHYAQGKAGAMP